MADSVMDDDEQGFEELAYKIVDEAICNAVQVITTEVKQNLKHMTFEFEDKEDYEIENIEWSSCQNFTTANGIVQITKFVETWKRDDAWLYCVDYLGEKEHDYDIRHKYRVRWSIPTRRKPIPRATACTYFTLSLSKIKPKAREVKISRDLAEEYY